jgi:hypothetical protein
METAGTLPLIIGAISLLLVDLPADLVDGFAG